MDIGMLVFLVFALAAVTAAVAMLVSENPVHCVLFLVVTILAIAGLMLTLHAEFLATLQVIVYAGAIMVLFLFVIMMLNLSPGPRLPGVLGGRAGFVAGGLLAVELVLGIGIALGGPGHGAAAVAAPRGTVENVGALLMTRYVFPMELASILLLVGMVGAVALARPGRGAPVEPVSVDAGRPPAPESELAPTETR